MCFYVSRSVGTPDMLRLHVSTYVVIDILRIHIWEHAHWISGEFLTLFDPSHLCVAQRVQKLQNHM